MDVNNLLSGRAPSRSDLKREVPSNASASPVVSWAASPSPYAPMSPRMHFAASPPPFVPASPRMDGADSPAPYAPASPVMNWAASPPPFIPASPPQFFPEIPEKLRESPSPIDQDGGFEAGDFPVEQPDDIRQESLVDNDNAYEDIWEEPAPPPNVAQAANMGDAIADFAPWPIPPASRHLLHLAASNRQRDVSEYGLNYPEELLAANRDLYQVLEWPDFYHAPGLARWHHVRVSAALEPERPVVVTECVVTEVPDYRPGADRYLDMPRATVSGASNVSRANELAMDRFRRLVRATFPDLPRSPHWNEAHLEMARTTSVAHWAEHAWIESRAQDIRPWARLGFYMDPDTGCLSLMAAMPGSGRQVMVKVERPDLVL